MSALAFAGAPGGRPVWWSRIWVGTIGNPPPEERWYYPGPFLTVVHQVSAAQMYLLVEMVVELFCFFPGGKQAVRSSSARCDSQRLQKIKYGLHPHARVATGHNQQAGLGVHMQVINPRRWNTKGEAFGFPFCYISASLLYRRAYCVAATASVPTTQRRPSLRVNQLERWSYNETVPANQRFHRAHLYQEDSSRNHRTCSCKDRWQS